jgi:transcriptional regulator with GAF, ATPase, and Fis domain
LAKLPPRDKTEGDNKLKIKKVKKIETTAAEEKPLKEPEKRIKEVLVTLNIKTFDQDSSEDTIKGVIKEIKKISNVDIVRVEIYDKNFDWYVDITDRVN